AGKVEPVMPGEIVTKVAARDAGGVEPGAQSGERAPRALEPRGVAQDADVVPHHIVQRLAHRLDVARGTPDRMAHARLRLLQRPRRGLAPGARGERPRGH